ncbi:MAG TPA: hypothetical protein VMC41_04335 [Candidatus Nanoarchaeia archaeon]|nr:hypothetical protein [Candidatus Nanoarchaeia archaeon]
MKPHVLSRLPQDEVEIFFKIKQVVDNLPDIILGNNENGEEITLSCHLLARAVGKVFGLKYVDGHSFPRYQHTWLITSHRNIIDVYPVATLGGPIMLDGGCVRHVEKFYKKKRLAIGATRNSFRRALRKIEKVVRTMI